MRFYKLRDFLLSVCFATVAFGACGASPAPVVYPETMASRSIPVVYINTVNGDSIKDKVTQIDAEMRIEVPDGSGFEPAGSVDEPLFLTIRGRGNATWRLPKKPYKLKLAGRAPLLGLPAHKHFALIAWNFGSGNIEWITSICGMEIARMLGMKWAPHIRPVELILNGNYEGMYFLTESVKIDHARLDIFEQSDNNTDPATIPYGWLVELDNYAEEAQIVIPETDNVNIRVTYHSPGRLSAQQLEWLTQEFTAMNAAIYSDGLVDWRRYIDPTSLAQYFIVREIMFDTDGFNGSMYMHKDAGAEARWTFGPMWDIGMGVSLKDDFTVNLRPAYAKATWEAQLMRHATFRDEVVRVWNEFYPERFGELEQMALEVARYCAEADSANCVRWPEMSEVASPEAKAATFFRRLSNYARWFDENKKWETDIDAPPSGIDELTADAAPIMSGTYDLQGRRVNRAVRGGIYVRNGRKLLAR